jgi:hypothetical protein
MSDSKINVYFRIKPFVPLTTHDTNIISYVQPNITIENPKPRVFNKKYNSTYKNRYILADTHDNQSIYSNTIEPDINHNNNVLLIAYGQTGSGKTHTLVGSNTQRGLIPIVIRNFISKKVECEVRVIEIYQDKIFDLQSPTRQELHIMEYNNKLHYKTEPTASYINTPDDIESRMNVIQRNKKMGCTKINATSSRAHTIYFFKCTTTQQEYIAIDLAGNERGTLSVAKNKESNREYISINKSLFALKECIRAIHLSRPYIPYRRSKLTLFLRDILHRKMNIHFIGTLNPSSICYSDIIDTIEYGLCLKQSNIKKIITPVNNAPIYKNHIQTKYNPICQFSNSSHTLSHTLSRTLSQKNLYNKTPIISCQSENKLIKQSNIKTDLYTSQSSPTIKPLVQNKNVNKYFMNKYFNFIIQHYTVAQHHQQIYKKIANHTTGDIPVDNIRAVIDKFATNIADFKRQLYN